jgi:hypothetical protein
LLRQKLDLGVGIVGRFFSIFWEQVGDAETLQRQIEIAAGEVPCPIVDRRILAQHVSVICGEVGVPFPAAVLHSYLDSGDHLFQTAAVSIIRRTVSTAEDLPALLAKSAAVAKTTNFAPFVNEFLLLAQSYLSTYRRTCSEIDDVLFGILQGRVALLDHNFPFDYDYPAFKLYTFLCSYIELLTERGANCLRACVLAPEAGQTADVGSRLAFLKPRSASGLWEMSLERLKEEWNESSICSCVLALTVNLRIRCPSACNLSDLLAHMQFMMAFLPTVFLDIAANETEKLPISKQIF